MERSDCFSVPACELRSNFWNFSHPSMFNQMERSEEFMKTCMYLQSLFRLQTELLVPVGSTFLNELVEQFRTQVYTDESQCVGIWCRKEVGDTKAWCPGISQLDGGYKRHQNGIFHIWGWKRVANFKAAGRTQQLYETGTKALASDGLGDLDQLGWSSYITVLLHLAGFVLAYHRFEP